MTIYMQRETGSHRKDSEKKERKRAWHTKGIQFSDFHEIHDHVLTWDSLVHVFLVNERLPNDLIWLILVLCKYCTQKRSKLLSLCISCLRERLDLLMIYDPMWKRKWKICTEKNIYNFKSTMRRWCRLESK